MPERHAMLSPSSAARWINCPPSAKINAAAPRRDSAFTEEGTAAHALAEAKARARFICCSPKGTVEDAKDKAKAELARLAKAYPDVELDGFSAMDSATDAYVDAINEIWQTCKNPFIDLEQEVSYDRWAPDGFGTADCVIIDSGVLHVIDFKYGKGVAVSAEWNAQMLCYAAGAYDGNVMLFDIDRVTMNIVQPRLKAETDSFSINTPELLDWADNILMPAAQLAAKGDGEMTCGPWCKWCANAALCRARADHYTKELPANANVHCDPNTLTPDEIGRALRIGEGLAEWLEDVQKAALSLCLNGTEVPGWKAVTGRSGSRVWTDANAAFDRAKQAGIAEAMLYERKPVTLAALEKIMGKKLFGETMHGLIMTPEGKPTLVEACDKRPAITNRTTAAEDFAAPID